MKFTVNMMCAYMSTDKVEVETIPGLLANFYDAIKNLADNVIDDPFYNLRSPNDPAVPINESVTDDYLVCLEDGKKLQMLKRHLKTVYNMSLAEYKVRWGLSHDYPTVCKNYTNIRSNIAKGFGLGKERLGKKSVRKKVQKK